MKRMRLSSTKQFVAFFTKPSVKKNYMRSQWDENPLGQEKVETKKFISPRGNS
jgi:hypothetical protein